MGEPALLVGETGCGKTKVVQHLANLLNKTLVVLNLNQQSESSDLLGGFKPVELSVIFGPLKRRYDSLFAKTFNVSSGNSEYLLKSNSFFVSGQWENLLLLFKKTLQQIERKYSGMFS